MLQYNICAPMVFFRKLLDHDETLIYVIVAAKRRILNKRLV